MRGRRFVRPTLTLTRSAGGDEVRALAELDHKPWTAHDGEPWTAVFPVALDLAEVAVMELTVAPDITVELRPGAVAPDGGAGLQENVAAPRAPVAKEAPRPRARPTGAGPQDLERLQARIAAAAGALERERERRRAAEEALEAERAAGRRLRIELGQLRAEAELARAGQAEAAGVAGELEDVRRQLVEAERRLGALTRERDRAAQAQAEVTTALHERVGALESARQALARERGETERLRRALAAAQSPGGRDEDAEAGDPPRRGTHAAPPPPRPLNPSLRHPTHWAGRLLALIVFAAVVVAIVLVIQGTIAR